MQSLLQEALFSNRAFIIYGVSIYIRLMDRKQRSRSVGRHAVLLLQKLGEVPGISVTLWWGKSRFHS